MAAHKLILVKFTLDLYYAELNGLFVTTSAKLNKFIQSEEDTYFGECAGKHSEVTARLTDDEFEVISDDQELIKKLQVGFGWKESEIGKQGTLMGSNPLD